VGDEEPDVAPTEDEEEDDIAPAAPRSRWSEAAEITGSLVALLLVTLSVLAFYLVGGFLVELIATAAPAVLAVVAAVLLARYLRRRSSDPP
jgi:hypothetical protein